MNNHASSIVRQVPAHRRDKRRNKERGHRLPRPFAEEPVVRPRELGGGKLMMPDAIMEPEEGIERESALQEERVSSQRSRDPARRHA